MVMVPVLVPGEPLVTEAQFPVLETKAVQPMLPHPVFEMAKEVDPAADVTF
jgi:hypothetical protein